uniref:DUF501 domain-containing protein n=1 Tax=Leptocylindrus danicus TaxID=163516 RepID=A0A7S2L927_9STRA|mmetsp:Transcript_32900/g.47620  ORF Transcript_32900/g.47620 Transcript_32900/m.47620 type:complete len:347 (+) Transcript_32900:1872-2912(+)
MIKKHTTHLQLLEDCATNLTARTKPEFKMDSKETEEQCSNASTKEQNEGALRKKRRRTGKTARRRRAKKQEIEGYSKGKLVENSDRSQSLPGVLERRNNQLDEEDFETLKSQLGFLPGNAVCVAARENDLCGNLVLESTNEDGAIYVENTSEKNKRAPAVMQLYPLAIRAKHPGGKNGKKFKGRKRGDGSVKDSNTTENEDSLTPSKKSRDWKLEDGSIVEPFPTIYWLTNPKLRILISKLEDMAEYSVKAMQQKLQSDEEALAKMKIAHENYGKVRWSLLTEEDQTEISQRKWDSVLGLGSGVAGIKKFDAVKCLHTHTAHYLAGDENNVIGKWTIEALQEQFGE